MEKEKEPRTVASLEKNEVKLALKDYMSGEKSRLIEELKPRVGSSMVGGGALKGPERTIQTRKDMGAAPTWMRNELANKLRYDKTIRDGGDRAAMSRKLYGEQAKEDAHFAKVAEYAKTGNDRTNKLVGVLAAMPADKRAVLHDYAQSQVSPHPSGLSLTSVGGPIPAPHTTAKHLSQAPVETGPRGGKFVRGPDGITKHYIKK